MPISQKCPKCGGDLASGGNCLRCLLQLAFEPEAPPPVRSGDTQIVEQPGDTITRYKLLQQIGEGGCGVVYMAEQEEPVRRYVAIKVIKLGMDTKSVIARFEAEQQAMALMDHPNIAKVLDAGATSSGRPFFVMELVRGIKITDFCDRQNLSTRERLALFVQVCNAIQHAHQKGVIHRDIKPSNVLVTMESDLPVPKVIDFGIAKATQQRLTDKTLFTAFEQFIGTPAYMSPEQAEMNVSGIDTRSDIYSLGVLLYELLTGQTPFDAAALLQSGIDEIRRVIREQEPAAPSTRLGTLQEKDLTTVATHRRSDPPKLISLVRGDLDWIVMKALEKDRTRRYETANGLARDVQRHLNDEPVAARPPGNLYRFQKMVRRNKLAFIGTAALMGVLAIGAVVSTWQAVRATRAERNANQQRELAEDAGKRAGHEAIAARHAAAQSDARYLFQERLLPAALARATESFKLGGDWEDGLLLHNIAAAARERWVLSARVPFSEPIILACVADSQNGPCLVESVLGGIRLLDARTGATLRSAPIDQAPRYLFKGPGSNSVVVVSDAAVSVLSLPSLEIMAQKTMEHPISCASVTGRNLLLVLHNADVLLFDLPALGQLDSFNWNENPATKNSAPPHQACSSPGGDIVLLHPGGGDTPFLVWDRRHHPATFDFTKERTELKDFQFYDRTHFAAWFAFNGNSDISSRVHFYDVATNPGEFAFQTVPHDDIKYALELQSWNSKTWNWADEIPLLGFIGISGMVVKGVGGTQGDFTSSDRFANLLPTEADSPKFLAADLAGGVLALRGRHDLLLFQSRRSPATGLSRNICATACRDGLLYVKPHTGGSAQVDLFFVPFDPRRKEARFSLQWPPDSPWLPLAIAATPDASTIAAVVQELEPDHTSAARYGRIRALIYHPGGLNTTNDPWPIDRSFQIDTPATEPWSPRFVALDSDAGALLYWNSVSTAATRYNPRDGKSIGALELGHIATRSRDGHRVAAVSPAGHLRVYDVASGKALLDLAGKPVSAMCFSTDGSLLVAAQANDLITLDIASGNALSSVRSQLLPLAYPSRGNRFLAFEPDTSGAGGSIVLADTADARITDVITRAGNTFTPAFFSDSGDQIALVRNQDRAEMVRSLNPADLPALLDADLAETAEKQPSTPVLHVSTSTVPVAPIQLASNPPADPGVLSAENAPLLLSHLGQVVTVEGRVQEVTFTTAGNAMHLEFVGTSNRWLLVWVPQGPYPKLMEVLGHKPGEALKNQTVRVTGPLNYYDGRHAAWKDFLQVTLDDPSKLTIVTPGGPIAATPAAAAVPEKLPATSNADTNVLDAADIPSLASQVGKEVTAAGRVTDVRFTAAGNAMSLVFDGPEEKGILAWVPRETYSELIKVLGQNPDQALKGRMVQVTGRLAYYGGRRDAWKGRVEITLKDPSKLLIVPQPSNPTNAASSSGSEPPGKH